jgi:hypothetical protein
MSCVYVCRVYRYNIFSYSIVPFLSVLSFFLLIVLMSVLPADRIMISDYLP